MMQDVDKELQIAKNIRALIAVEIFSLIGKVLEKAYESDDPHFDLDDFKADCGLCYIKIHEDLLVKYIYNRYPDLDEGQEKCSAPL